MEVLPVQNIKYNNKYTNQEDDWQNDDFTEEDDYIFVIQALSKRLEEELRTAKTRLSVGEVLLPNDLTRRIARDLFKSADTELCGLRGCTLIVNFVGGEEVKRLTTIKFDPTTPSTFELHLTLKQSTAGWNAFLPQFLKKITRGGTVMISADYDLQKKKLYRFFSEY